MYIPLHMHYAKGSIGDSILKTKDAVKKAKNIGIEALSITDHGSMANVIEFYKECNEHGVKPLIGLEAYECDDRTEKQKGYYHLVLLAKNKQGYKDLLHISEDSQFNGYYYKPRTDISVLRKHGSNLIALSACLGGRIPKMIMDIVKVSNDGIEGLEMHMDNINNVLKAAGIDPLEISQEDIINDYINTGEPVGSRTIAKRYDLGVGSATIRNEMSDLEDMGYLEQPHTSAGRVPSSKGYRLYVDNLMQRSKLSIDEELRIKKYLIDCAMLEVDKIVKQASTLLSELTNLTCVVQTPSVRQSYIKSVQLLMVDEFNLVSVIVTDSGVIKNHRIKVAKVPSVEELQTINKVINSRLQNLTIDEINLEVINNLKRDFVGYDDLFNAIVTALYDSLKEESSSEIFMEGTTNIFNYQEYNDIESAKEILNLLYNKDYVIELIEPKGDITIKIGDENYIPGAKNCSVISAEYSLGDRPIGTIGLIGPQRINYSRVISIMAQVMKELNDMLKGQGLD